MTPDRWHDDWKTAGAVHADPATVVHALRREQKRLVLTRLAEFAVLAVLLALAAFALLRGPQISDTLWAAGVGAFLFVVACAVLISRRNPRAPAHHSTGEFLAAYETSCRQRLRVLHWAWIGVIVVTVSLLPFAVWRYRASAIPLTSHHGAFSAGATAVIVFAAVFWIRFWQRRTAEDLEIVRNSLAQPDN